MKKKEQLEHLIELAKKVFGNRIKIEKKGSTYEVFLGEKEYEIKKEEDVKDLLDREFDLSTCKRKKEYYEKFLKLSQLYFALMLEKEKRMLLKEIIPSLEKVTSAFFDAAKYCPNEHLFDYFDLKELTYDSFVEQIPSVVPKLRIKRKEEKEAELENYFLSCKTKKDLEEKIKELKRNKETYQDVCNTLDNFISFYQEIKTDLEKDFLDQKRSYRELYDAFLKKVVNKKETAIKEYYRLYKAYLELSHARMVLETIPYFEVIQKTDTKLKKEKEKICNKLSVETKELQELGYEIENVNFNLGKIEEKSLPVKLFLGGKKKALWEQLNGLTEEEEKQKKIVQNFTKEKEMLEQKIVQNENHLAEHCKFEISISEFEEKKRSYEKEGLELEELKKEEANLKKNLETYSISDIEKELEVLKKNFTPYLK